MTTSSRAVAVTVTDMTEPFHASEDTEAVTLRSADWLTPTSTTEPPEASHPCEPSPVDLRTSIWTSRARSSAMLPVFVALIGIVRDRPGGTMKVASSAGFSSTVAMMSQRWSCLTSNSTNSESVTLSFPVEVIVNRTPIGTLAGVASGKVILRGTVWRLPAPREVGLLENEASTPGSEVMLPSSRTEYERTYES